MESITNPIKESPAKSLEESKQSSNDEASAAT